MTNSHQITNLLLEWNKGNSKALDELMPLVEMELRRIASKHMRRENAGHTLQTTALVNEAYLKLIDQKKVNFNNRSHFFSLAAQLMRRILVDYARHQKSHKRGGKNEHLELSETVIMAPQISEELIALDMALDKLAEFDPLKARIVEMRHFGGLEVKEVADVLKIAEITVMRHWKLAKAWIRREIEG